MTASSAETGSAEGAVQLKDDPKRLGRLIFGALFLGVFIGYYIHAGTYSDGTLSRPGPGMFPGWVGIAGIAASVIVMIEALLGRSESGEIGFPRGRDLTNVLLYFGMVVGFILLLPVLGQYIASAVFAVAFIKMVGSTGWIRSIIIGVVMAVVLTLFFDEILGLRLPTGVIL